MRRVRRDEWGGEMEWVWRLWGRGRVSWLFDGLKQEGGEAEEAECTQEHLAEHHVWSIRGLWLGHSRRWKCFAGGQDPA